MDPRPPGDSAPAGRLGGERRPSASPPCAAAVLSSRRRPAGLSGRAPGPSVSAHARGRGSGSRFASLPPGPCASPCLRVCTPGTRGTPCSQTTPDAVVAVRRRGKPPPTSCLVFPVKRRHSLLTPSRLPPLVLALLLLRLYLARAVSLSPRVSTCHGRRRDSSRCLLHKRPSSRRVAHGARSRPPRLERGGRSSLREMLCSLLAEGGTRRRVCPPVGGRPGLCIGGSSSADFNSERAAETSPRVPRGRRAVSP